MTRKALAHTGGPGGLGHDLSHHSEDTASRSGTFAAEARPNDPEFAAMGEWSGLLHDLGKYRPEVQDYLAGNRPRSMETQHSIFGATQALILGLPYAVSVAVASHHTGLPDLYPFKERLGWPSMKYTEACPSLYAQFEEDRWDDQCGPLPTIPAEFHKKAGHGGISITHQQEFRTRMLFSCLIDADCLDTERFRTGKDRTPMPLDAGRLLGRIERHCHLLSGNSPPTPVNIVRDEVYRACVDKATGQRGFYRLTAPTGAGKTLALMAFALKHAETHGLRRVIVVLPFLAIIDQNAKVYRDALREPGEPDPVIEHHSSARVETGSSQAEMEDAERAKQATENWDAPVIVTTAVQFLESLFSQSTGRCRKLHNIAQSVVIIDEVQTLPFPLLEPILNVARDLRDNYGVTFVFGSATQPQFELSHNLPSGMVAGEAFDILDGFGAFAILKRTTLELPLPTEVNWSWEHLADQVSAEKSALAILNLRKHAQALFYQLKKRNPDGVFHLSSTMCPSHRRAVLGDKDNPTEGTIFRALKDRRRCLVASTQVVEAGVDISFPIVFRAAGPLDAIIQAAGRCDREGELTAKLGRAAGRVIVFRPCGKYILPPGFYQEATDMACRYFAMYRADPDRLLHDPMVFQQYHEELIAWGHGKETGRLVQEARTHLNFKTVANLFSVIDTEGQGIVIPYGEAPQLIADIRRKGYADREAIRALQPYTVNLFPAAIAHIAADLRPILTDDDGLVEYVGPYDEDIGIRLLAMPPEAGPG